MYFFKSERLGFRNWREKDIPEFIKMNRDPKVMRYFPNILSEEESRISVERFKSCYANNSFCFYAIDKLEDSSFIGFIGISAATFKADFTPCTEIGWRLKSDEWGKGYATEGASRCLEYGFSELKLSTIYSFTPLQNKASENVMKKIGMNKVGTFNHPSVPSDSPLVEHVLYVVTK
ncbi:MAG: GNAT family N-acetyltransferase [Bacteroidota bacterium]